MPSNEKNIFAKIDIRENVIKALDSTDLNLLEPFAGTGEIFEKVYKGRVKKAVAIDNSETLHEGQRKIFRGTFAKVLRTIDVHTFNIFDIDTFNSPWYAFWIICSRLERCEFDKIGFVVVENQNDKMFDKIEEGMKKIIGIKKGMDIPKLSRHRWYLRELVISKGLESSGYEWKSGWRSTNLTKKCDYMGFVVQRKKVK